MRNVLIILIATFISCTDASDIPFEVNESRLVIEGWLTDQTGKQYVRISRTVPFTSTSKNETISDATVTISESNSNSVINTFRYTYSGNGYYYSDSLFSGLAGRYYTLNIELPDGKIIRSLPEQMNTVNPIDSIKYSSFTRESEDDPDVDLTIYYPVAWTSDPAETANFYRWKLYRNNTLFSEPGELFLFNDRFLDSLENYPQQFTTYEYQLNDTIRAERIEISRDAFDFLTRLKAQTTSLGTNTAVSPAAVTGNLSFQTGEAMLGFFGAASITSGEVVITE